MAERVPRRPTIWLNCAISLDGRLAYAGGRPARLSGPEDLVRVNRMRSEADAILVGVGTVLADDPSLRVHYDLLGLAEGRHPRRIVLDSRGRTPAGARVLDGTIPTLIAVADGVSRSWPERVRVEAFGQPRVDLSALLEHLEREGTRTVMVEGGSTVLASFLRARLFDRLTVYIAPLVIGGGSAPTMAGGPDPPGPSDGVPLAPVSTERLGVGTLLTYVPAAEESVRRAAP